MSALGDQHIQSQRHQLVLTRNINYTSIPLAQIGNKRVEICNNVFFISLELLLLLLLLLLLTSLMYVAYDTEDSLYRHDYETYNNI